MWLSHRLSRQPPLGDEGNTTMITGHNHTSITVSDMDTMLSFYRDIVGMKLVDSTESKHDDDSATGSGFEGLHMKVVKLKMGSFVLELVDYVNKKGQKLDTRPTNIGSFHIGFTCSDIHAVYADMVAKGVRFKSAPYSWGEGRPSACYGLDPDSNRFELTDDTKFE